MPWWKKNMKHIAYASCASLVLLSALGPAQAAEDRQSLEELRNTIVNLLDALVEQGVMTREKAQQLVKQAQEKATADAAQAAAAAAQTEKAEQGAVRVPYVPQIVKDEISKQVAAEVKPAVVADVVQTAKTEKWGIPGALPEWLGRVSLFGDVLVRGQVDAYARDNVQNTLLDFNAINAAGGISKAGPGAFLDVTEDRYRMRLRARLGVLAQLTPNWTAGLRLSSGSLTDPGSESQTLGTNAARYTIGIDQAFIRWNSQPADRLAAVSVTAGRFANPWLAPTELVYARDLQFEGLAETTRFGFGAPSAHQSNLFLTLGGFPLQETPLDSKNDKWLAGGQLGIDLSFGERQRLRLAGAYYDFLNVTGRRNLPDSTLLNYTAPAFIRFGNTVFDISNSTTDTTVNLFALAAHFRIADVALAYELPIGRYSFGLNAEAAKNIGYRESDILNLTGQLVPARTKAYVADFSFGSPAVDAFGKWRTRVGYRYVQRDAVIDAWTDADFHEGGTNTAGYYVWQELGVARNTWFRLRYLSGNEIDGLRYGLDIIQLDLLTTF